LIVLTQVTREPLDVAAHLDAVASPQAGASAVFIGTVRDHDPEATGEVVTLEYSAHPDAERILAQIASLADTEHEQDPTGLRIAVSHRIGKLEVGEAAIVCAVSSAHRADAFDVARDVVERVKANLPGWKRQHEADGTAGWVGLGGLEDVSA
jgi:molybdopterin synthase catalytic subunit